MASATATATATSTEYKSKLIFPQIFIIVLVSALLYNRTIQQRKLQTEGITATMGTIAASDSGDVKEMFGVKIERNPSQSKLDHLGISSWPKYVLCLPLICCCGLHWNFFVFCSVCSRNF